MYNSCFVPVGCCLHHSTLPDMEWNIGWQPRYSIPLHNRNTFNYSHNSFQSLPSSLTVLSTFTLLRIEKYNERQITGHVCTIETCSSEALGAAGGSIGHAVGCHACEQRERIMVSAITIYWMGHISFIVYSQLVRAWWDFRPLLFVVDEIWWCCGLV